MINLLKRRILIISLGLVLVALTVLLTLRTREPETGWWIDEVAQAVAYPFLSAYRGVSAILSDVMTHYVYLANVQQENERLRLQVQALQEELNHHIDGAVQFNLLREQLEFLEDSPDTKVFAEVIGESADMFHHTLVLNKGSWSGIRRNFPVVLREGVVGRIQSVTALQSTVELITDRRHRFPALVQRSRERLVSTGAGEELRLVAPDRGLVYGLGQDLRLNRVRMLADVQRGDRIVTSGLSGIFPKGLMVGTVANVQREQHELFQSAEIDPAVDFNRIEWVFVILRDTNVEERPLFTEP